jgi:hypothetical protein
MAARREGSQGRVWQEVAAAQDRLRKNLRGAVAAPESASSFQLTLESERVKAGVEEYVRALSARGLAAKDVVGCAFAVNGKLSGAEVYASSELFARLWPKLLKAAAVEAIAEQGSAKAAPPAQADVRKWMAEADRGQAEEKALSARVKLRRARPRQRGLRDAGHGAQGRLAPPQLRGEVGPRGSRPADRIAVIHED